jgi:hypothetical protein
MKYKKIFHKIHRRMQIMNIIIQNFAGKFCIFSSITHNKEKKNFILKRNVSNFIIKIS